MVRRAGKSRYYLALVLGLVLLLACLTFLSELNKIRHPRRKLRYYRELLEPARMCFLSQLVAESSMNLYSGHVSSRSTEWHLFEDRLCFPEKL